MFLVDILTSRVSGGLLWHLIGIADVRTWKINIDSMSDGISQRANSFFL